MAQTHSQSERGPNEPQPAASACRLRLAALALTWLCVAGGEAQAAPLALNWVRGQGAESCMSGKELQTRLDQALAAENVAPAALTIEGLVQRDAHAAGWRARLRVLDASEAPIGTRELISSEASCDALTPSIILVLALLVELGSEPGRAAPAVVMPAPQPAPVPAPAAAPPASAPLPVEQPKPSVASAPPSRWQAEPIAALTLALGLLPGASLGPQLGLRVRTPWPLSLLAQGGYWPGSEKSIDVPEGTNPASLTMRAGHADLSLCLGLPRPTTWWLAGCWGFALGARHTQTTGLADSGDEDVARRFYAAATAMAQFGYQVSSRLSLALNTSFLGFTREDTYWYEDAAGQRHEVFRASRFAGLLALGLGVRL